jgi:hypothetical protein
MTNKTSEPVVTGKMRTQAGSPPGIELDGEGNVIPLAERTAEDRAAAIAAGERDSSIKNPEQELEHPAPMPHDQQGQGGKKEDRDPEGQQGGYHK